MYTNKQTVLKMLLPLSVAAVGASAQGPSADYVPAVGGYYFDGTTWSAFTTTGTAGFPADNQPAVGLWGYNSTTKKWYPCGPSNACMGGGGGGSSNVAPPTASNQVPVSTSAGSNYSPQTLSPVATSGSAADLNSGTLPAARYAQSVVNLSSAAYNVLTDCKESPVSDANGVYLYSTYTGTCTLNDTNMANLVNAAGVIGLATPTGANGEAEAGTTFQAVIKLESGKTGSSANNAVRVSSMPYIPDGVTLDLNGGTLLISSTSGNGPIFRNNNSGSGSGTPGTAHDRLINGRIVYVGAQGTSTGIGAGFLYGKNNFMRDVGIFNFNTGLLVAGTEYSTFDNMEVSHNNVNLSCVPANFSAPAAVAFDGTPSINTYFTHFNFRNGLVGINLNGCNTSTFKDGTISFNRNAAIVMGALDFAYVDTFTVSGGAGCPANSTIPITVSGTSTIAARGALITGTGGAITGAFQIDGGKGYTGTPTASIPNGTCTTNPTITPHVTSMASNVFFSGAATSGVKQTVFEDISIENEGVIGRVAGATARPIMGHQVIADTSTAQDLFHRIVFGLGGGDARFFAHFMRDEGYQNTVSDLLGTQPTDPFTAATCPVIATQASAFLGNFPFQDPSGAICYTNGTTDTSANHAATGFFGNLFTSHGYDSFGSGLDTALQSRVTGEPNPRMRITNDGTMSYFTPGTATIDGYVGRIGTAFDGRATQGGIWGPVTGYNSNRPTFTGVFGNQAEFTVSMVSFNGTATYPNFATTGIPSGMNCTMIYTWTGSGTGTGAQYTSKAYCNDGYNPAVIYQSQFHTIGSESYSLDSFHAAGFQETLTTPSSSTAACAAGQFTDDANYHYVCTATNTWKRAPLNSF